METYFTLHCLARSISNRVKHQIEHQQVTKAEHLHRTDQRVTGDFWAFWCGGRTSRE